MALDIQAHSVKVKVIQIIPETSDAISLVLDIPTDQQQQFRFQAGQFLTLFLNINGETLARSYSLSSSPEVDQDLKITIKRVPGGKGSNYILDQVKVGDTLQVAPPAGFFFKNPTTTSSKKWNLFAAGSGITPIFSILKTVLKREPQSRISLFYCNKDEKSIIYKKELEFFAEQYKDRLKVYHILSQQSLSNYAHSVGRINPQLIIKTLKEESEKWSDSSIAYICGPIEFMNTVKEGLKDFGYQNYQIQIESFSSGISTIPSSSNHSSDGIYIGDKSVPKASGKSKIEVHLNGETSVFEGDSTVTILETLIAAGANPPYSCLDGNCMACVAKVKKGRVIQKELGILLDENIEAGDVLTCQAKPDSPEVYIDFDVI